jgi:hypothetical protein
VLRRWTGLSDVLFKGAMVNPCGISVAWMNEMMLSIVRNEGLRFVVLNYLALWPIASPMGIPYTAWERM